MLSWSFKLLVFSLCDLGVWTSFVGYVSDVRFWHASGYEGTGTVHL